MRHRDTTAATTEVLSGLDPAYLAAKERLAAGKTDGGPIPKRQYGRTKEELSIIGFGSKSFRTGPTHPDRVPP